MDSKQKKRIIIFSLLVLIVLSVIVIIVAITNPLIRSEETIRDQLLKSTPLGTSMEDIISFVKSNKRWEIDEISYEHGFWHQEIYPRSEVGKKSIRVELGDYRFVFVKSVTVFYGFDENSKLIDIWVWKTTDSI